MFHAVAIVGKINVILSRDVALDIADGGLLTEAYWLVHVLQKQLHFGPVEGCIGIC